MDGLPVPRRYLSILALSLGTCLAVLDGSMVSVALPTLTQALHIHPAEAVLIVTVYQLVLLMTMLPFSALGARMGYRRLYQHGQVLFALSCFLCVFVDSLGSLLALRLLQALGAATTFSLSNAMVRLSYPPKQLGRGLAVNNVVVSSSSALAPVLGGLILTYGSWHYLFGAVVPLVLISLWIGHANLPDSERIKEPYDVLGAVLCALTFGLNFSGIEVLVHGASTMMGLGLGLMLLITGIIIAVFFVRRELRASTPILPVDLLAKPVIGLSALGGLLSMAGSATLLLYLPFRLHSHYGFTPQQLGAAIAPWPLAMAVAAPLSGLLSDRFAPSLLAALGMIIATAATVSIALLPEQLQYVDLLWRMVMLGAGFGMYLGPNLRIIVGATPISRAASTGGLIATNRLIAQTLGATLVAALLAFGVGDSRFPAWLVTGMTCGALLCALVRARVVPGKLNTV